MVQAILLAYEGGGVGWGGGAPLDGKVYGGGGRIAAD